MRSDAAPDLSDLARLAQNPGDGLRPLLLRIHARAFASAPSRDPAMCAEFATLALGLIPLVTDDVLADTSALLSTVDDVPPQVTDALRARLAGDGVDLEPVGSVPDDPPATLETDRALASDCAARIDARTLGGLVERAACDPILAAALLRRPDLGTFDRAVLFAAADSLTRDAIRAELDGALAPAHRHLPDASTAFRDRVVQAAGLGTARAVSEMLKERLPLLDTGRLDLSQPAGQELFVLALGAAGLAAEDSIRIVLTLDVDVARSVAIVFRLAEVARSTSRRAAAYLVEEEPATTAPPGTADLRETRRAAVARSAPRTGSLKDRRPDRAAPDRAPSVQAGPRSRSTTGPDRI